MMPTRKQFIASASSLKPGDHIRIKVAGSWEYLKGWDNHQWFDVAFVSFDGKEAVFQSRLYKHKRFYVSYRQIKTGEYLIIWDRNQVFTVNPPTDLSKNNILPMWEFGKLKHY